MTQSGAIPQRGDVLVSKLTARVQHELSIVPETRGLVCRNHESAVARARRLAQERGADAWLTEDHIHFLKIASYRTGASPARAEPASLT